MNCPHCNVPAEEEGALFCGECGGSMQAPSAGAAGVNPAGADPLLRCLHCGAGPTAIDEDGFCNCGQQRRKPARDHFEVIITPKCAGVSDIGHKHHQNEDFITLAAAAGGAHVLVLCDGVSQSQNPQDGSRAGSDAACASAVAQIAAAVSAGQSVDMQAVLRSAIVEAQNAICRVPFQPGLKDKRNRDIDPAQSTIVMAVVEDKGRRIHFGWAGDSRAYWVSKGGVVQITRDDSWADEQVAAGRMTMQEAMARPEAHAITNSLGALPDGRNPGISPTTLSMNVTEAGRLLICSDGFWNYAEDPKVIGRLVDALPANADALTVARALVNYARDTVGGGKDNISVIIREF